MNEQHLTLIIEPIDTANLRFQILAHNDAGGRTIRTIQHEASLERINTEVQGIEREVRRCVIKKGTTERLEGHARLLFDLLFPPFLKVVLRESSGSIGIVAPSIAAPWSLLHDGDDFLVSRWSVGEIRELHPLHKAVRKDGDQHRLLIIADPAEDLPAARYEGEAVVRASSGRHDQGGCDLRLGRHRRADLLRMFHRYDLVHFAGHVDSIDEGSGWRLFDGHLCASDIRSLGGRHFPSFIFVNACQSSRNDMVTALLESGVKHLVCTRVDLPDLAGADFATHFYESLCTGYTVGESLQRASLRLREKGDPTWLAHRLIGDPSSSYFSDRPADSISSGRRNGAVVAFRRPRNTDVTAEDYNSFFRDWRRELAGKANQHGGRLLPGCSAVQYAVFGIPVSYENDLFRAAIAALEAYLDDPDLIAVVGFGELLVSDDDIMGPTLHAVEHIVWTQQPGAFIDTSAASSLAAMGSFSQTNDSSVLRIDSVEAPQFTGNTPLVGREHELNSLSGQALTCLKTNHSVGVLIVGPAGMGKSHISHALTASLSPRFRFSWGRCVAYAQGAPYAPFAQILRDMAGIERSADVTQARSVLSDYLSRLDATDQSQSGSFNVVSIEKLLSQSLDRPALTEHLEPLLALLGYQIETRRDSAITEGPIQIANAFASVMRAASQSEAIGLVIEDVHWLPDNGLRVVAELLEPLPESSLFVMVTARPGVVEPIDRWAARRHVERLQLGPLGRRSAEEIVRQTAPGFSVDGLKTLVERAEGNPLFLKELALSCAGNDEGIMPPTIDGVVQARLDRETSECQELLRACSIFGRSFWVEGIERLVSLRTPVEDLLRQLERGLYILRDDVSDISGAEQWRFAHGLLYEVVYQGIPEPTRRAWHGRAALWMSQETSCDDAETKARIASHLALSGDKARAAQAWFDTGESARGSALPGEARRAFERAMKLHDEAQGGLTDAMRGAAAAQIGELAHQAGELAVAEQWLDLSIKLARERHDTCHVEEKSPVQLDEARRRLLRSMVWEATGRLEDARSEIEQTYSSIGPIATGEGVHLKLELRNRMAWLTYRSGNLEGALDAYRAVLEDVPSNEWVLLGQTLNGLGVASYGLGDYLEAQAFFRQALEKFELANAGRGTSASYNNLGMVAMKQGDTAGAVHWYERAVRMHARAGDRTRLSQTYNNLGSLYGAHGEYKKAEGFLRESIRIRADAGLSDIATGYANLGECLMLQGQLKEGETHLRQALKLLESGRGSRYILPDVWRCLAEVILKSDPHNVDQALTAVDSSIRLAEQANDRSRICSALRVKGQVLAKMGDTARASEHFALAIESAQHLELPLELARAKWEQGVMLKTISPDLARELIDEACAIFDEHGIPHPSP